MNIAAGLGSLSLALLLSGCAATYSVPAGAPTAKLLVHVVNDSTDTTLRTAWASTSKNEQCEGSARLVTTLSAGNDFNSEPILIEAKDRVLLSARYGDARYAQNRSCASMLAFSPKQDHQYQLELVVRNNVADCRIGIFDVTPGVPQKVPFELPKNACSDSEIKTNGRPLITLWTFTVEHVPRKK